jgi:hypothetical protein
MGAELHDVAGEVADRLRRRGIVLGGDERPEDLADLLSAVEQFESAVEARGGDLMVNDDPRFALPPRSVDESVRDYVARVQAATVSLREINPS